MNDTNRYRLAYANLRVGNLDQAEKLCRQIRDPALTGSAAGLLKTISEQRADGRGLLR